MMFKCSEMMMVVGKIQRLFQSHVHANLNFSSENRSPSAVLCVCTATDIHFPTVSPNRESNFARKCWENHVGLLLGPGSMMYFRPVLEISVTLTILTFFVDYLLNLRR